MHVEQVFSMFTDSDSNMLHLLLPLLSGEIHKYPRELSLQPSLGTTR